MTQSATVVHPLSRRASLDRSAALHTIHLRFPRQLLPTTVADDVHRFQESIAGRSYLIEVSPVAADRWRAYIVRIPGVPTALMPFYGATPDAAAKQLCDWLTRAHARAASAAGTV